MNAVSVQLRDYQREAVEAVERELSGVRATLLVLPTGGGKTVTFGAVARNVVGAGGRVLVLAHRSELLDQAAATLARFGLRTGIECAERRVDRSNLPDVAVASVQTLRGERLASFPADTFALVVVDEAHHSTARSYRAVLEHFAGAKVLGVTATPERLDGVGLRNCYDSIAFQLTLRDGIQGSWLAPIELQSIKVEQLDLSRVRSVAGELHAGELEAELLRDSVLHQIAQPLAEQSAGRQTLAFCVGVKQSHALASALRARGVAAAAVDGSMGAEQRARVLDDYRAGRVQVVCNAMLWAEGFDAPQTSCIALVRPTRSRSLVMQMLGRGTRPAPGKTSCLVLDFVPGRFASTRLASPADALAGEELPPEVVAVVREQSQGAGQLAFELIEAAKRAVEEAKAAEQAERIATLRRLNVVYEVTRMSLDQLLEAVAAPSTGHSASTTQIDALHKAGLRVPPGISRQAAVALLEVVAARRAKGLCSIKQGRKLRSYGLRDDLLRFEAHRALTAIADCGWRPSAEVMAHLRREFGSSAKHADSTVHEVVGGGSLNA